MFDFIISFLQILKSTWQIWIFILSFGLFFILVEYLFKWLEELKTKKWFKEHKTLEEWKKVDSRKFEKITAIIFKNLGYKTKVVGGARDWGIDIIAKKDGKRIFIQCKRMDKISPGAIREFYGSIVNRLKEGEKGIFVTTGKFSEEGREFIRDKPIELIDGIKLEKLASQF